MTLFALIISALCATQCTQHRTLIQVNAEEARSLVSSGIPIYFRFYFAGCVATPRFQPFWEEAAASFPQVTFASIDCIGSTDNANFCQEYITQFNRELRTPSHFIVNAGQIVPNSFFYTPVSISKSSQDFQDNIRSKLGFTPVDVPMVHLTNVSSESFYNSSEYTTFLLYNSGCEEDVQWLGRWANVINQSYNLDQTIRFGFLDCSQYEYECKRWGSAETAAIIYKRNGDRAKIASTVTDIEGVLSTRLATLRSSTAQGSIPLPVSTPEPSPEPTYDGYTMVKNEALESRTVEDVKAQYASQFPRKGTTAHTGSLDNCAVGTHDPQDITDTTNVVNLFRSLAGLNTVSNKEGWNEQCMKTASALHTLGYITHEFPSGASCYSDVVKAVAANSNLYQGSNSAWDAVSGWIMDLGEENAQHVGHRRLILLPALKEFGIGYVAQEGELSDDSGSYINYKPSIAVMQISEQDQTFDNTYPDGVNFISWPSAGPFPVDHLPPIWSICFPDFSSSSLRPEDLIIRIKRQDGLNIPVSRFYFSRENYGSNDCLLLEISPEGTAYCSVGSTIHVQIYITTSKKCLDYSFTVFETSVEKEICFYSSDASKCGTISEKYGPEQYSTVNVDDKATHLIINVAEPITLAEVLIIDYSNSVQLINNPIAGTITIGPETSLLCEDPSQTDFIIQWNNKDTTDRYPSVSAGKLETSSQPKSITVNIDKEPTFSTYYSQVVYAGPLTNVQLNNARFENDISDLVFGVRSNNTHAVVIFQYVTELHHFGVSGCSTFPTEVITIDHINQIVNYNLNRRTVRIDICDKDASTTFSIDSLDKKHKLNYEIVPSTGNKNYYLKYNADMLGMLNKLTFRPEDDKMTCSANFDFSLYKSSRNIIDFPIEIHNVQSRHDIYIPNILGDENAINYFKPSQTSGKFIIHDDSNVDSNGFLNVTEDNEENNDESKQFIFYTSDKYDEYIVVFKTSTGQSISFFPKPGTEDHPVKINVYDGVNEHIIGLVPYPRSLPNAPLYFTNYKNLSVKANFEYPTHVNTIAIENFRMVNPPEKVKGNINISSSGQSSIISETDVTYQQITIEADTILNTEKVKAEKLSISPSISTTINSLTVTQQLEMNGRGVTFNDCIINNVPVIVVKNGDDWPLINLISSSFNPTKINVDLNILSEGSLKLLANEESHIFIDGLTTSNCDAINEKIVLSNNGNLQAKCSNQKTSIYFTNAASVDSSDRDDSDVDQPYYPGSGIDPYSPVVPPDPGDDKTPPEIIPPEQGDD